MARSDLLVALVKAGTTGDKKLARTSAEALIADEREKQHHVLADRLAGVLSSNGNGTHSHNSSVSDSAGLLTRDIFIDLVPKRRMEEMLLPLVTRSACEAVIEEQQRADVLRSHGLEPRHRILLVGPPGNGKTSLAEAIAEALSVPFLVVRYESVIGSFLGETASRLRRVFDYARTTPCVLFFDEFDVVGKERGDIHEMGKIKRVVSSLLLQIDDLPSWTVVTAATNHPELLDRAVWRRFQLRLDLPAPDATELAEFIRRFFHERDLPGSLGRTPEELACALLGMSLAEAEDFCTTVLRRYVLSLGAGRPSEIVESELKQWRARIMAPLANQKGLKRGGKTAPIASDA